LHNGIFRNKGKTYQENSIDMLFLYSWNLICFSEIDIPGILFLEFFLYYWLHNGIFLGIKEKHINFVNTLGCVAEKVSEGVMSHI